MTHAVPLNLVGRFFRWFYDLWKAPGRIAELSKAADKSDDGRFRCKNCKTGRVGNYKWDSRHNYPVATCDSCSARWYVIEAHNRLEFCED